MWGIFGKLLKRAIRNTGSADMFEIFVRFGRCLFCLFLLTGSHHVCCRPSGPPAAACFDQR